MANRRATVKMTEVSYPIIKAAQEKMGYTSMSPFVTDLVWMCALIISEIEVLPHELTREVLRQQVVKRSAGRYSRAKLRQFERDVEFVPVPSDMAGEYGNEE